MTNSVSGLRPIYYYAFIVVCLAVLLGPSAYVLLRQWGPPIGVAP